MADIRYIDKDFVRFTFTRAGGQEAQATLVFGDKVDVIEEDGATVIELHVADDDMGKVIGRNGSVAKALRTLLKVTAAREGGSVTLEIV